MINPAPGVAFTEEVDGNMLDGPDATRVSMALGIGHDWATVSQVHGASVVTADGPGNHGVGDAIVTSRNGVPVAVRTADCIGVVGRSAGRVGVAHAGWRGLAAGILEYFSDAMGDGTDYFVGPSIGPCCYEVGADVAERFPEHLAETTWGARSVDLRSAAQADLGAVVWWDDRCTRCSPGLLSHRRSGTPHRMAALGWL